MRVISSLTAGILMASMYSSIAMASNSIPNSGMSAVQKTEMEKVIHDYLVTNPEVLLEASQVLQQKQQKTMLAQTNVAILENASQLLNDGLTVVGNPKGKVTLVEFFDYQCGHCQKMSSIVADLVKKDSDLRVVYKEFPIFGKNSQAAAKFALAAALQGKYQQMQEALLMQDKSLNQQIIMTTAKSLGLDMKKLEKDGNSKVVLDELEANRALAEKLHLMGTPAFIIASTTPEGQLRPGATPAFVPGASSIQALQDLIAKAKQN